MRRPFSEYLQTNIIVSDGAMGTELYSKGVFLNRCFDELNLSHPELVQQVHHDYLIAGAEVIETNTFGANRIKLEPHGLADRLEDIIRAGVRIAREVAGDKAYVGGSIGPLGVRVHPYGKISMEEAKQIFSEQVNLLLEEGVDLVCLETFVDRHEIQAAILAAREVGDLPVMAMFTLDDDGNSQDGSPPEEFALRLQEWGADIIGVNCGVGPQVMLESLERIASTVQSRLVAQPNAGKPRNFEGRNLYLSSPEYLANYARRFVQSGVHVVGGCCGTTPAHIHAIRTAVQELGPGKRRPSVTSVRKEGPTPTVIPPPRRSPFAARLYEKKTVEVVHIVPSRGVDPATVMDKLQLLKEGGVDAVRISEAPRSSASMGALALAVLATRESGVNSILHYTCRDRDLLVMQSELLGAHALGVRNLFLSTGEPIRVGAYFDATAVMDVDAIGLTRLIAELNEGRDLGGKPLNQTARFFVGVSVNAEAAKLKEEVARLARKVAVGAHYVVTEPVVGIERLEPFLRKVEELSIPVIVGVRPLTSLQDMEFLVNEISGVHIPDWVAARMREASSPESQKETGIEVARKTAAAARKLGLGVEVVISDDDYATALKILS